MNYFHQKVLGIGVTALLVSACSGSGSSSGPSDAKQTVSSAEISVGAPIEKLDRNRQVTQIKREYYANKLIIKLADGQTSMPKIIQRNDKDRAGGQFAALNNVLARAEKRSGNVLVVNFPRTQLPGGGAPLQQGPIIATEIVGIDGRVREGGQDTISVGGQSLTLQSVEAFLESSRFSGQVEHVEKAYVFRRTHNSIVSGPGEPNDTYANFQWHYGPASGGGAGFTDYWQRKGTGPVDDANRIVVAVLDTGQVYNHEDISSANLIDGFDFISDAGNGDGNGRDSDATDPGDGVPAGFCGPGSRASGSSWHGSHVSGTIGSASSNNSLGVASAVWGASIMPVRVLGKCGGSTLDIADAIRWAAGVVDPALPPAPARPAQIINMSLGGPSPVCGATTQDAINDARAAGAMIIVAAGNSAMDATLFSPANCDGVITVSASEVGSKLSYYSNFGYTVEIMAPGGDTTVDLNNDNLADGVVSIVDGGYQAMQGTSMAAPHVSAAAALIWGDNPAMNAAQITAVLLNNSRAFATGECFSQGVCGQGHLDMAKVAQSMD